MDDAVAMPRIRGQREWLDGAREIGELGDILGANWNLEIGGDSELVHSRGAPSALLSSDIAGYPTGMRVLTGSWSGSRQTGLNLGLGAKLGDAALVEALRGKSLKSEAKGPVDLNIFPSPFLHEQEGGRVIGTSWILVTSDPNSSAVNGGPYRQQVQDPGKRTTLNAVPSKHHAEPRDTFPCVAEVPPASRQATTAKSADAIFSIQED